MPGFIKPQLATLKAKAPKVGQWIHEIKYDGYRVQVHVNSGRKKVYSKARTRTRNPTSKIRTLATGGQQGTTAGD